MSIITTKRAAGILEVSEATVRNWVKHGYLSSGELTKNNFRSSDVDKLKRQIESGEIKRLRKRANKKKSDKSFVPEEYLNDTELVHEINKIRNIFLSNRLDLSTTLFVSVLKKLFLSDEVSKYDGSSIFNLELYTNWKRDCVKGKYTLGQKN